MSLRSRPFIILALINSVTGAPFAIAVAFALYFTHALIPLGLSLLIGFAVKLIYSLFINNLAEVTEKDAVFITGTSKGLGRANVMHLIDRGYTVFAGVRSREDGDKLLQMVKPVTRRRLIPVIVDVVKPDTIDTASKQVKSVIENMNLVLRAVVNNSAIASFGALEIADMEQVKQSFDVNVFGMIRVNQAFLPLLRDTAQPLSQSRTDKRARLVLMASVAGRVTSPWMGVYSATKAAIETLGDAYRMELLDSGIDVCVVEPGKMDTESQNLLDGQILSHDELRRTVKSASSAVIDHYSTIYEKVRRNVKMVPTFPVEQVTTTIEHVVRAKYVQPRYQCSPDSASGAFILGRLPEMISDRIMKFMMG